VFGRPQLDLSQIAIVTLKISLTIDVLFCDAFPSDEAKKEAKIAGL
jgi:hypothetical protein